MRVEFSFDNDIVEQNGYKVADIYYTIKKRFDRRNISCVSDGDVLAFEGRGNKADSTNIWIVIMDLLRADWFVSFATSCMYYDRDTTENVLSQAWKVRNGV